MIKDLITKQLNSYYDKYVNAHFKEMFGSLFENKSSSIWDISKKLKSTFIKDQATYKM
jgi:hypothetical protein